MKNLPADRANPPPGTYIDKTRNLGVNARKWSIQARNHYMTAEKAAIKRGVPGPGQYEEV